MASEYEQLSKDLPSTMGNAAIAGAIAAEDEREAQRRKEDAPPAAGQPSSGGSSSAGGRAGPPPAAPSERPVDSREREEDWAG